MKDDREDWPDIDSPTLILAWIALIVGVLLMAIGVI